MSSLSNLVGSYMSEYSESEPEDETKTKQKSFSKEIGNLLNEINDEHSVLESGSTENVSSIINLKNLPATDWTQCLDPNTGHPYYWNISTKEVTWDKPIEYDEYLNKIEKNLTKIPDDCWIIGYSDSKVPYYVNEYTRVVSWVKPENFKPKNVIAKKKKGKIKNSSLASKKLKEKQENKICIKKKLPKHLRINDDTDVKIELIQSYSAKSSESSDSDTNAKEKLNLKVEHPKRNLVAAYSTEDDDSETDLNETAIQSVIPSKNLQEKSTRQISSRNSPFENGIDIDVNVDKSKLQKEVNRPNTFASIITGDKPEDQFNDEINKLKQELEKELSTANSDCQNEDEKASVSESECFVEKNFQRKRRIEFGTNRSATPAASTSKQSAEENDESSMNSLSENNTNKNEQNSAIQLLKKKNLYMNFERSHVEFTNNKLLDNNIELSNGSKQNENKTLQNDINELSYLLLDKVKFLNIGHDISPVQAIQIQLETLIAAYNSSALDNEYFFKWLKDIENDLINLEANAAPVGWMCKWDRKESKYFYENSITGEIKWEYPNVQKKNSQNKKISNESNEKNDERGEMEMEISTTPPPNENEQIIVKQHLSVDGCWDADNAPPPPIISMPSPPLTKTYSINNELASFYSDIATLDTSQSNLEINNSIENEKRSTDDSTVNVIKKKRKKMKVQGLGTMNTKNEVFSMVAKWEKVQKELNQ